jgi:hypothetical protein
VGEKISLQIPHVLQPSKLYCSIVVQYSFCFHFRAYEPRARRHNFGR